MVVRLGGGSRSCGRVRLAVKRLQSTMIQRAFRRCQTLVVLAHTPRLAVHRGRRGRSEAAGLATEVRFHSTSAAAAIAVGVVAVVTGLACVKLAVTAEWTRRSWS